MAKIYRKVGLEGVRFIAPVGYFPEERLLKNEFLVNLNVGFEVQESSDTESLDHTVDYSRLFEICQFHFRKEALLLETLANEILEDIILDYHFVEEINIKINKINPPIVGDIESSFVELNYKP